MQKEHYESHKAIEKNALICKVVEAKHIEGYVLHIKFNNSVEGNVDLAELVNKGIFRQIKNLKRFSAFSIDHGVLTWSQDIDIAPEYLYTHLN